MVMCIVYRLFSHFSTIIFKASFQSFLGDGNLGNLTTSNYIIFVTPTLFISPWWALISLCIMWIHFYLFCFNYCIVLFWFLFHLFLCVSVLNLSACKLLDSSRNCAHLAYLYASNDIIIWREKLFQLMTYLWWIHCS